MKVMCIKNGIWSYEARSFNGPTYGNIYTVVDTSEHEGDLYYHLNEYPYDQSFIAKHFIPCSDIDETEMVRETLYVQNLNP